MNSVKSKSVKIGFIGSPFGDVYESYRHDSDYLIKNAGDNTGNVAFWLGFTKILGSNVIKINWHDNPEKVKDTVDVVVIAAANFLMENYDLKILKDLIEGIDKPVIISGLGAQSESEDYIPKLSEGTVGFLKAVSKRTDKIGLRGEFSKKVCDFYGVTNTEVIGCPAILINNDKNLSKKILNKWKNPITHLSSASASIKGNLKAAEARLFNEVDKRDGRYVIQRPLSLIKAMRHEELKETDIAYLDKFREFINPDMSSEYFINFLVKKGQYFSSAYSWLESLKTCTHAVGTRIHGSLLPIMSQVPSICITHDTRTRELVNSLCIPSMSCAEFGKFDGSLEDLFEVVDFDTDKFDENRVRLANFYRDRMLYVGCEVSKHLIDFI